MIKQETCAEIWKCYREIETATKLLAELTNQIRKNAEAEDKADSPPFEDAFGRKRYLELGVPSGPDSRRLYEVPNELGVLVIEGYITSQQKELVELQAKAATEINLPMPDEASPVLGGIENA